MNTPSINGMRVNYRQVGEGPDLVLIHGLAANHAFWHLNVLLPLARGYRVTVYDLRGHGYSGMPRSGYTSAHLAEDLLGLLDHLGIRKAGLVGHSLGGVVALHFAALHPERVARLVIADSRVRALQPTQRPRDWPNWATARPRLEGLGLPIPEDEEDSGIWLLERLASPEWRSTRDRLKGTSLFVPFSSLGGGNRSAARWLELLETTTAKKELTSCDGLSINRLATIRQPTLVLCGEHSPALPSFRGLKEHLPRCRGSIVPGAGHFFPLSRPELFVRLVREFLDTPAPSRRSDRLAAKAPHPAHHSAETGV